MRISGVMGRKEKGILIREGAKEKGKSTTTSWHWRGHPDGEENGYINGETWKRSAVLLFFLFILSLHLKLVNGLESAQFGHNDRRQFLGFW